MTDPTPHVDRSEWLIRRDAHLAKQPAPYYAMYSSIVGGIVTDPALMCVPVDDHVVHRGDGVFETLKCVNGAVYSLPAHLQRLAHSAEGIGLRHTFTVDEWTGLTLDTVRAGGHDDALIRILLTRGPGSLGVNPYDCPAAALYIVAGPLAAPFMQRNHEGARIGFSAIPSKPPPFASIKHCNYLFNALMAKEARDRGLDFVIGLDPNGRVLEGPTENVAIVTREKELLTPDAPHVLPGTTLERVLDFCPALIQQGLLTVARRADVSRHDVEAAQEILIIGTSHDVIAVRSVEEQTMSAGPNGPVFVALQRMLSDDVRTNPLRRTPL